MENTIVTLRGFVATWPEGRSGKEGKRFTRFRMAVDRRRQTPGGQWETVHTTFYTVKAWDKLAGHVMESVKKGDPVVVVGRLNAEAWKDKKTDEILSELSINAKTVGHDLGFGVANFVKRNGDSVPEAPSAEAPEQGDQMTQHEDEATTARTAGDPGSDMRDPDGVERDAGAEAAESGGIDMGFMTPHEPSGAEALQGV